MAMPKGDTPQKAHDYYQYLLSHHETERPSATWHVVLILLWWVGQYRTTRHKERIYPVDTWGGFTTELAGPASRFFILLTAILVGFAVAILVGHVVNGQIF